MNIWDLFVSLRGLSGTGTHVRYGIDGADTPVNADNTTVLYTCIKILSDYFSRVPVMVKDANGKTIPHRISDLWNYAPSNWMNPQTARSTSEWDRNAYGNSFFEVRGNKLEYIPAREVVNYYIDNSGLTYEIQPIGDVNDRRRTRSRKVSARNLLHFRGVSADGVFGLSPLSAAFATHQLMQNATATVSAFYRNGAMQRYAIETTVPSGATYQQVVADRKQFADTYAGPEKAGGTIHLPLGEKITPLAVHFADAELIQTLEFTRDTITSVYQIPNWMLSNNDSQQNVEEQTAVFVGGAIANIANAYKHELEFKMLTPAERQKGVHVEFDLDVLLEATFTGKINAFKTAVNNGLMTPDQANRRLGFEGVDTEFGKYHFTQAQYIPLERYNEFSQLKKDSPVVDKALSDNDLDAVRSILRELNVVRNGQ